MSRDVALDRELKVLLVEDNPREKLLIESSLEKGWLGPVSFQHYTKVLEAVSHLAYHYPDVVLLDLHVLDSDGLDTVKSLMAGNRAKIPVVVVTSLDDQKSALSALELGAQDYIIKGEYSSESLAATIRFARARTMADLRQLVPRDSLQDGDFAIDLVDQSIIFLSEGEQRKFPLTPTELRLASYLLKNLGRNLSRNELRLHIWGADTPTADRVIDNQISRLRSKINGSSYEIKSVRGSGYSFVRQSRFKKNNSA